MFGSSPATWISCSRSVKEAGVSAWSYWAEVTLSDAGSTGGKGGGKGKYR